LFIKKNCWQQDIHTEEYVLAAIRGVIFAGMAGYLFYDTALAVLPAIPLMYFYMRNWQEEQCRKKEQDFRGQFKEAIEAMASALSVGYSVENAFHEASRDMDILFKKQVRIKKEMARMVHQLSMNQTVEHVMMEFADRVIQEDVHHFVTVFVTAKRSGGDSITLIRNAVRDISEKIDVEKEIDTILAAKKLEFRVMCVIPLGILCYMRMSFPEFMEVLYGNLLGTIMMTCCLIIYIAAFQIGRKITEIEV
jgi:tight adherence protein B